MGFGTDRSSADDARCSSSSRVSTSTYRAKTYGSKRSTSPQAERLQICSRLHMICTKGHSLDRDDRRASSGAPTDSLGRARGDGWDAAGGPVPRAETRVPCLFKHLSLTRGEHVAWGDPRPRGTRLVAPRPPAFSLRAPPVVKQEVSLHPRPSTRAAKVRVSALLHGTGGRFHASAYFRPSGASQGSRVASCPLGCDDAPRRWVVVHVVVEVGQRRGQARAGGGTSAGCQARAVSGADHGRRAARKRPLGQAARKRPRGQVARKRPLGQAAGTGRWDRPLGQAAGAGPGPDLRRRSAGARATPRHRL